MVFSENMEHRSGGREYLPLWCFGRDGEYIALKITPDKRSNSQEGQENIYPCLKLICENIYPWKMEGVSDVCGGQDVFLIHYGIESFLTIFLSHFWQSWFSCAYFGPSGVRALPLASGINESGHYFRYFCPSEVHALPLAAGINEGGHYFRYFFPLVFFLVFFLPPLFKTTEGVVVGIQIFAWAPK